MNKIADQSMQRKNFYYSNSGSASQFALMTVLAVIILSSALFILISGLERVTIRERSRVNMEAGFADMLQIALEELGSESDDKADSYFDFYDRGFAYDDEDDVLYKELDGYTVSIREHSGKLPINTMNTNLVAKSPIRNLFKPNVGEFALKDFRSQLGLSADIVDFMELFASEAEAAFFTAYGFANFNTSSEDSLAFFGAARIGNEAAGENIRGIAQEFRAAGKIADLKGFKTRVLLRYPEVNPFIGIVPVLNINFAGERVIRAICSYPFGDHVIPNSQAIAQTILNIRNQREIIPDELEGLIPTQKEYPLQKRIFQYFGTSSWFWEIILEKNSNRARALVVRFPSEETETSGDRIYRIAEYTVK